MSARVFVDLNRVYPVFDGCWHRVNLSRMPQPGEEITTFCGRREAVEYGESSERSGPILTCWGCDLAYRRQQGVEVLPDHPAIVAQRKPRPYKENP